MRLDLGTDQRFLQETTARFLDERATPDTVRGLRHDPAGFDPNTWREGCALGWTSLLVDEDHGGGRLSEHGLLDLVVVAHEFGRHAAPGPLLATNLAAAALSDAGGPVADELLPGLVAGTAIVSWWAPWGPVGLAPWPVTIAADDGDGSVTVTGTARSVEAAGQASHVVVAGRTGDGCSQVVVPTDAPGVTVTPQRTVDLTRRFATVTFDQVRVPLRSILGQAGRAADQVAAQVHAALALSCAEAVGAMDAGLAMTIAWAFDRYSFGRPLASYQALKHRFADMKTWLETGHGAADEAAAAAAGGQPDAAERCSAAKAYIGHFGAELLQDCVQMHGGIGVTFDHDLHLYLRRHVVHRMTLGTPTDHRRHLAVLAGLSEAGAAA
jgi:alkylation response protein AidB-like acyl-CoA dehydrogenase